MRAYGWRSKTITESEMALFHECMPQCAQKELDTADIVRDACLQKLRLQKTKKVPHPALTSALASIALPFIRSMSQPLLSSLSVAACHADRSSEGCRCHPCSHSVARVHRRNIALCAA